MSVSWRGRGHNVIVFDKNDSSVIKSTKRFDTYGS